MSVAELERAATAPFRWIVRSSSKDRNAHGILPSRRIQILKNSVISMMNRYVEMLDPIDVYLVPGGRYLVVGGPDCLGIWDLGGDISSDGKPTMIWATTVNQIRNYIVQPTPDGLGIRILACLYVNNLRLWHPSLSQYFHPSFRSSNALKVFEIYPQNQTHEGGNIAELVLDFDEYTSEFLSGNRAVIYAYERRILVVWDFVANTLASWSVSIPNRWGEVCIFFLLFLRLALKAVIPLIKILRVTETAIILYDAYVSSSNPRMWIFQIPPLIPKSLFFNYEDLPVAPILVFKDPEITAACHQLPDYWYYGYGDLKSFPLYLDVFEHQRGDVGRYTLDIASDLSSLSLTPVPNAPMSPRMSVQHRYTHMTYRICGDSFVNVCSDEYTRAMQAITVGFDLSSQTPATHVSNTRLHDDFPRSTFCPASARFIYTNHWHDEIFISDFL
jgi:hypothetical protein